jgi:hypothetical protein
MSANQVVRLFTTTSFEVDHYEALLHCSKTPSRGSFWS